MHIEYDIEPSQKKNASIVLKTILMITFLKSHHLMIKHILKVKKTLMKRFVMFLLNN